MQTFILKENYIDALYDYLFVSKKESLEFTDISIGTPVLLPDTDIKYPKHQRSKYYISGSWGKAELGGSRWPPRWKFGDN